MESKELYMEGKVEDQCEGLGVGWGGGGGQQIHERPKMTLSRDGEAAWWEEGRWSVTWISSRGLGDEACISAGLSFLGEQPEGGPGSLGDPAAVCTAPD